jgi:ABC-type multidrug transport system ATPase subunit
LIGGWLRRGVSGGERKRISIGYELITNPSLMLLDEPTSGLDSSTSLRITKILKNEAARGMAVLATIHQPSADLLFLFDRVMVLSDGFTIFNGPPKHVEEFFSHWGFKMPRYANPADKLSSIASEPWRDLPDRPTIIEIAEYVKLK